MSITVIFREGSVSMNERAKVLRETWERDARKCGAPLWNLLEVQLCEALRAAILEEREACAKLVHDHIERGVGVDTGRLWRNTAALTLAAAIRSRR